MELGAYDYMSKPFEPRELVARIQTILRRVRDDRTEQRANIRFDNWRLNSVLRQLVAELRHQPQDRGVVHSPDGKYIVAYGKLRGPDWYFLIRYPANAVAMAAARSGARSRWRSMVSAQSFGSRAMTSSGSSGGAVGGSGWGSGVMVAF